MTPKQRIAAATAVAAVFAAPLEGLRQYAYYDPPGILSVCYGSTTDVQKGRRYSVEECKARLNADMLSAVETVDRCQPGLPDGALVAMADAVYNLGPTIACDLRRSTAARYMHDGQIIDACNQLPRWNKGRIAGVLVPLPGLIKRRGLEKELCLKGLT